MGAAAGHRHRPAAGAAPRDRAHLDRAIGTVVPREVFEIERDVGLSAFGDEVAARNGQRVAGILLVAGQENRDVGILERSGGLHGAKRGDDHRDPAFVVAGARAERAVGAVGGPALERRIGLEHGIEVRDQEQPLAVPAAGVPGDQMARAPGRFHVDPLGLEAERGKLGLDQPPHRLDPGEVHRPAVLVDPPLEQGQRSAPTPGSTTSVIFCSAGLSLAVAGAATHIASAANAKRNRECIEAA